MIHYWRILLITALVASSVTTAQAIQLYFAPDSSFAAVGDTIRLSGQITPTDTLRGFSVYLVYDTTKLALVGAPVPGSLIASRSDLDFRYADHVLSAPDWLEVGATVFSADYWAGPGELFQMSMVMRGCGDEGMTAEVGFRQPGGEYIAGDFSSPAFLICDRVPVQPGQLVAAPWPAGSVTLRWNRVMSDTLGRPILFPVRYDIHRQPVFPLFGPEMVIAATADSVFVDALDSTETYHYTITATTTP
ncbi:hypothetical protein HZB60_12160 [candidate division KSB1 bacterium]|nr:hypothetical protein [candidate division KSB1 bacterium]